MRVSSLSASSRLQAPVTERRMTTPEQKKRNLRMALVLASIVAVFFIGFIAKMALLAQH